MRAFREVGRAYAKGKGMAPIQGQGRGEAMTRRGEAQVNGMPDKLEF